MEISQKNTNQNGKFVTWFRTSITARMLIMGTLVFLLMIPLALVQELIIEREHRQRSVMNEINDNWGNEIVFYGPILKVPYKTYEETVTYNAETEESFKEKRTILNYAYFFPEQLNIDTHVDTERKKRNNFDTAVFKAGIKATGHFETPNFSTKSILEEDIVWDKATLIIHSSNLKGLKSEVKLTLNGNEYGFETNYTIQNNGYPHLEELESSFIALADIPKTNTSDFQFELEYNGSEQIEFVPIGKVTNIHMTSDWKDPKHIGNFTTQNEQTTANGGFEAEWKILSTNRSFSQQFFQNLPQLTSYAVGTNFIFPLDEYQKSQRSAKYGFLVIGLTFLVFFLIQTLSKISIHPFQYIMIGLALIMFYTLLISISEHSSFLKAYLIAGIAVIVMITLYSRSILKKWKFPLFIGATLTTMYGFIFVIIQLESYALLVGSIGLFIILGIVMYVSRKIDWYVDPSNSQQVQSA